MTWYDGGDKFPDSKKVYKEIIYGEKVPDSGLLLVGEKGSFSSQNELRRGARSPAPGEVQGLPEPQAGAASLTGGFTEFVHAIKSGNPTKAMSNFDYAGRLTETVLLGVIALKTGSKIDSAGIPRPSRAGTVAPPIECLRRDYRKGFSIR